MKEAYIKERDEFNIREASENELAGFVLDKTGVPVDRLAVAVILETYGIQDVDAVKKFGRTDVFDLADRVYDCCRTILADVPELTVSITAYNNAKYVGETIASLMCQDGVVFELIAIDDGSGDNTTQVVQSFEDSRIKLMRNERHMGLAYCYNLAIEQSKSPFVAFVGAHGLLLPGAFQKMIERLKSSADTGQVNCYSSHVDEDGIMEDSFRGKTDLLHKNMTAGMDYKGELLVHRSITNHLRMYRREVFIAAGKFDETVKYGLDYDMALRIVDKYDIKLVPELLYCDRTREGRVTKPLYSKGISDWVQRLIFCCIFLRDRKINFTAQKEYNLNKLMIRFLYYALRLTNMLFFFIEVVTKNPEKLRRVITSLKI
ncbi:MAG: glycosyltransferase family 2 protein [Thermodesulfobacteriota bacterium]